MPRRDRAHPAAPGDEDGSWDDPGAGDAFDLDDPAPRPAGASGVRHRTGPPPPAGRAPDPAAPGSAPASAARTSRGPDRRRTLAAVVGAAVLAALLTAGVETHRHRDALADAVAVERAAGAVDAGDPALSPASFGLSGDPVVGEDGSTALHLTVPVSNAGESAVAVTVTGLGIPGLEAPLRVVGPSAPQQLDPLEDGVALLDVGVDCAAVPADEREVLDGGGADRITASIAVGDEVRAVRWTSRSPYGGLAQQLVDACHTQRGAWVEITGVEQLADGRLRVDVENRGEDPTSLQVTTPSGSITGDPALPLLLAGDAEGSVVLTASPDCAQSRDLVDLTVSVTAGTPGDASTEHTPFGGEQLTAWMGGRAALTCS